MNSTSTSGNGIPATALLPDDQLRKLYVTLTNMKQQVGTEDPTFINLREFLRAQVAQRQQQQMNKQQQQMATMNVSKMVHPQPQQSQQQQQESQKDGVMFTEHQQRLLKCQIYAFKNHILKNEMVPASLWKAICGEDTATKLMEYERFYMNPTSVSPSPQQREEKPVTPQQPQVAQRITPSTQPGSIPGQFTLKTLTPEMQLRRQQQLKQHQELLARQQMQPQPPQPQPHIKTEPLQQTGRILQRMNSNSNDHIEMLSMPIGVSLPILYQERERRIGLEMRLRFEELKMQMAEGPQEEKRRAVIEMKKMQLLHLQKQTRKKIMQELRPTSQIRSHSRNGQAMGVAGAMDLSKSRVAKSADDKKKQHKKFLRDIAAHHREFSQGANVAKDKMNKLNGAMLKYHEKKEKTEREAKQRDEKVRLKLLKENDTDGYFKLLEETKADKIKELIKETDRYLAKLGAKVTNRAEEDASGATMMMMMQTEEEDEEGESIYSKHLKSQQTYYELAHTVKEKVEKQPTLMTNGELKPYQMQGLSWLVSLYNNNLNGILADEMGLGKTIQTIALLGHLYEYKNNKGPHLVIVPLGTIENWRLEFEKWYPELSVIKYGGPPPTRKKLQRRMKDRDFNVLLIQYEYISRDRMALSKIPWEYVIIDEGHRIKNQESKLLKDLLKYKCNHRLLLTGTPLQNDLSELWSLLNFLLPHVFSDAFDFDKWFNSAFNSSDSIDISEEETLLVINRLHQVLRPFLLRREKSDVLTQLPEKVEKLIRCNISAMQELQINRLQEENRMLSIEKEPRFRMRSMPNPIMALRKICNHPFLTVSKQASWTDDYTPEDIIRMSGKFELLHRMLPKLHLTGHRVLLFSQMTQLLNLLEEYLDSYGYKDMYLRLDGTTKADERPPLMQKFNAPDSQYFLFLLSTRAGGLGLNLQTADTVIIFDSDWNPQMDLQAQARAHRLGQTKAVRVFTFLTATPIEEGMYQRATDKRAVEAKVIAAGKFNQKSTHKERQDFLAELIKSANKDDAMPVPSDEELNDMIARTNEEFELFQKMDEEYEEQRASKYTAIDQPVPPRLASKEELPQWLFQPTADDVRYAMPGFNAADGSSIDSSGQVMGRGKRKRQTVHYMDLSDEQFEKEMMASDDEDDEDEDYDASADGDALEQNIATPSKKRKMSSQQSAVTPPPPPPQQQQQLAAEAPTAFTESDPAQQQQHAVNNGNDGGGLDGASNISVLKKEEMESQLNELSNKITTPRQQHFFRLYSEVLLVAAEDGYCISEPFLQLPDRQLYPDYYDVVKNPISFQEIEDKVVADAYSSMDQMTADMALLVKNAQTYNLEQSAIYQHSMRLWQRFVECRTEWNDQDQQSAKDHPVDPSMKNTNPTAPDDVRGGEPDGDNGDDQDGAVDIDSLLA